MSRLQRRYGLRRLDDHDGRIYLNLDSHWPTNRFPDHRNRPSLCVCIINSGVQELETRGVDLQRLQAECGFSLATLRQPHLRLPAFLARRFWEVARELSADPAIGLAAARQTDPAQMLGLAYLMQLMPSRFTSLQELVRYWPLLSGNMAIDCVEKNKRLHVSLLPSHALLPAVEELDFWGALQVQHLKGLPGTTNAVLELRLRRNQPNDPAPWLKLSAGMVQFNAEKDEVVLDIAALHEARPPGSLVVCNALVAALRDYAKQTARESVLEAVANSVLANMAHAPSLEQVADQLHMTSRTLHRNLQREGWTFNTILEVHRRYLACDLVKAREMSVSEVAERLGYREVSNFIRAFRRWYGVSPSKYQEG